jgi:3-oxoacyl-[acyl-carrier-protein] synthase-3
LHGRLGLRDDVYCVDINQGCAGFIYALLQACVLVESTSVQRALICVGDTLSHRTSTRDRNSYPLVGDAGAVALLERSPAASPIHLAICNRGSAFDTLMIPAGGARRPSTAATREEREDEFGNFRSEEQLTMKGGDVFNFTQTVVPEFIEALLADARLTKEQAAWFFLHQANTFIVKKLAERLGVPFEKAPSDIVSKYGNSSSATIPLAMAEHFPAGVGPLPVCLCGFGVGLSWGGAVLELGPLAASTVIEYTG